MKQFKFYNNIIGWMVFIIASVVYLLTIEPTTSLWDCGEFIASAFKLEVGHPPGAPFFMILARFFSIFTSDTSQVAKLINSMSALASSFTILFLFWTITHFARKLIVKDENYSVSNLIAIYGAGVVGALAYTFSDTFWFSAVEGEVYALSSLFTAVVFWAIVKWENVADEKHSYRWLILIAYLMGLSIGVHLLNLLAIPAIVFVIYFKKFKINIKGFIYATLISVVLLGVIMYGIIPGIVEVISWFELLFVNSFGMPYKSGFLVYAVLIIASISGSIYFTHKKADKLILAIFFTLTIILFGIPFLLNNIVIGILLAVGIFVFVYLVEKREVILNTIIIGLTVILIGYSSFAIIVIRSMANPPMDENNPENVFSLLSYLNREQYGDRPLVYGQYYDAPVIGTKETSPVYIQKGGKYVIATHKLEYEYDKRFTTLFPRMWSSQTEHVNAYKEWGKIKGKKVRVAGNDGNPSTKIVPTFGENLRFFFSYQIGYMYLRYFMWNFAGKQNDTQGHGEVVKGNWLSGVKFIDELRLGTQENLPGYLKNDKSRNVYYFLPLILGLIGLLFHYYKDSKDFFIVLLLFILTGLAIVVYLNQTPYQPRERDYAYAGSFYAFAIWIGLGVVAIFDWMAKKIPGSISAILATLISFFLVPGLLANENWNDHDRSGRYTARDFAYNYLNSCAPNAILFTNGDNDTFPLWYAQEVEGIRTDVRIVNLSLFNTDWYTDQMRRKAYDSDPIPGILPKEKYVQGTNDIIFYNEIINKHVDLKDIINWVNSDDPRTKVRTNNDEMVDFIPTSMFRLPVDKEEVVNNGTVKPENSGLILPAIEWQYKRRYLEKKSLLMLDILAFNDWQRPIYHVSSGTNITMGLDNYLQLEGFAYRLVPIYTKSTNFLEVGRIDTDILYDNLMNNFRWGRMNEPDVFIDFYNKRTATVIRIRNLFSRLAGQLTMEGKKDSAVLVLDRVVELMPDRQFPYDFYVIDIIREYYNAGANDKGKVLLNDFFFVMEENVNYYLSLKSKYRNSVDYDTRLSLQLMQECIGIAQGSKDNELFENLQNRFRGVYERYSINQ
ncbi:MAG: DUF2723 domain-containing protein [Bacteroidales bacterium]|nr:DUF2723 domain-containing protein [Bacteroidales bacterium]